MKRKGLLAALILGLVFGVALGPCTFAYMAPMLGVTFKLAATNPFYGAALLLAYGIGHCSVIVAAGTRRNSYNVFSIGTRFTRHRDRQAGLRCIGVAGRCLDDLRCAVMGAGEGNMENSVVRRLSFLIDS